MSWEGHLLRKPVGWGDISTATGVGGPPYDLGTMIANGTLINKWALHKPVRLQPNYDTPTDISEYTTWISYMQSKVAKDDGTGSAPFGLLVGTSYNLLDVNGVNSAPTIDWSYQRPPATGSFWRRSLDFAGYTDEPNVPLNKLDDFTYYKNKPNVLIIDTNDGEAGDTSIPIASLSSLNSYRLMLVIRKSSTEYCVTVMSTTIPNSVDNGLINFALPDGLDIYSGDSGTTYSAWLVGVTVTDQSAGTVGPNAGVWLYPGSGVITNYYKMIPLPFASKTDCAFQFTVKNSAPETIIYLTYVITIKRSTYVIQKISFSGKKNGYVPSGFTFTVYQIDVFDDNNVKKYSLQDTIPLTWTDVQASRESHGYGELNVSALNINAGDAPYLTYQTIMGGASYTIQDGGFYIDWVD